MEPINERIAFKLKNLLVSKGLNQSQVAEKTGLTLATVNAFCNARGKIIADSLIKICEALNVDVESLFLPGPEDHPGYISPELAGQIIEAVERAANEHFHQEHKNTESHDHGEHDAFAGNGFTPQEPGEAQVIAAIVSIVAKLPRHGMNQCLMIVQGVLDRYDAERAARKSSDTA